MSTKKMMIGCALVCVFAALAAYPSFAQRIERHKAIQEVAAVSLPKAQGALSKDSAAARKKSNTVLSQVNWDVPFTPQAPTANWDAQHEEACEEAAVAMVMRFFDHQPFTSAEDAERTIQHLLDVNEHVLHYQVDQTAQQVAALLAHERPQFRISVRANPTQDHLKQALSDGFLVIVPAAGRQVGNPYYQRPGPHYHMLVLRGYTDTGYVITNDPGTKRGKEFVYRWESLLPAVHDWNDGDVAHGAPVAILVGPYIIGDMN